MADAVQKTTADRDERYRAWRAMGFGHDEAARRAAMPDVQPAFARPPRRTYKDRMGQVITDPETIEARWLQDHIQRAAGRRYSQGLKGDPTVGDVATAIGLTPERVVEIVRKWDVWLWGLAENDGPMATWGVFLDGE